ncbi:MAG TPA: hypothetical protein VNU45_11325, partial [Rummeliibacillus sp.]|nr:hypothetical protein [Rummeliibacillus sp.]
VKFESSLALLAYHLKDDIYCLSLSLTKVSDQSLLINVLLVQFSRFISYVVYFDDLIIVSNQNDNVNNFFSKDVLFSHRFWRLQ